MIGVIPAAGEGNRLNMGVKALVEVGGKHLIEYPLQSLKNAGVKKAIIIEHGHRISNVLGHKYKNLELLYVQQNERRGIAHAISLAEPLVGNENMFIILGDVVYKGDDLADMKNAFERARNSLYCVFCIQPVEKKEEISKSYGFMIRGPNKPIRIIEKPSDVFMLAPYLGLGIYVASPEVFDYIRKTPVNPLRGEIEITDTLNLLAQDWRADVFVLRGKYVNVNAVEDLRQVERVR